MLKVQAYAKKQSFLVIQKLKFELINIMKKEASMPEASLINTEKISREIKVIQNRLTVFPRIVSALE